METPYIQISSKGQIVIPAELREQLNLGTGTKVSIQREGNVLILRPITDEFIDGLAGCTHGLGDERERSHKDDKTR